jgi:hypothetical protein
MGSFSTFRLWRVLQLSLDCVGAIAQINSTTEALTRKLTTIPVFPRRYKKDNVFAVASAEGRSDYSVHCLLCCDSGHFGFRRRTVKIV